MLPTLAQREGAPAEPPGWPGKCRGSARLWVTWWLVPVRLSSGFNGAIRSWLDLSGRRAGVASGVTSGFSPGH